MTKQLGSKTQCNNFFPVSRVTLIYVGTPDEFKHKEYHQMCIVIHTSPTIQYLVWEKYWRYLCDTTNVPETSTVLDKRLRRNISDRAVT